MKLNTLGLTGMVLGSLLSFSSCKKTPDVNINQRSSGDNALAENLFMDVYKQVDDAAKNEPAVNKTEGEFNLSTSVCANVNVSTVGGNFPVTIEIDYGNGCLGVDGRFRKGKIVAVFTGRYKDAGTQVSISLDNYFVNGYRVEGAKTISSNGINANGHYEFAVSVVGGKVVSPEQDSVLWNSTRVNEWVSGDSTYLNVLDDVYSITGSAEGTNTNGEPFSVTIKEALEVQVGCRWPLKGKLTMVAQNNTEVEVNYAPDGIEDCNQSAAVIIDGKTYNFTMY
jgi:hypothetical protein